MASREPRGGIKIIQTKRGKYVLLAPEIRYPGVVFRESFALHTAPFRSRTDRVSDRASRADDEGTGVVPTENPGAGRTSAPGNDPQEREPLPASSPVTKKTRTNGKHPGRQELPASLPRVEKLIPCTDQGSRPTPTLSWISRPMRLRQWSINACASRAAKTRL
jgi:hypothetical protein